MALLCLACELRMFSTLLNDGKYLKEQQYFITCKSSMKFKYRFMGTKTNPQTKMIQSIFTYHLHIGFGCLQAKLQNQVVVTETEWPAKSKIFTNSSHKNFC